MTIKEKKQYILNWKDFYGSDIIDEDMVKKSKSNDDLIKVLNRHSNYIELQAIDAQSHLNQVRRKLKLW